MLHLGLLGRRLKRLPVIGVNVQMHHFQSK